MKKTLYIILAFLLCISLCACGNETNNDDNYTTSNDTETPSNTTEETTENNTEANEKYSVGETASTEVIEFTLNSIEFADSVSLSSGDNFLLPCNEGNGNLVPNEGKVFVCFSFSVKNIGKAKLSSTAYRNMSLSYSDGYKFDIDPSHQVVRTDDNFYLIRKEKGLLSLAVLTGEQTYRGYIEVPKEVMENAEVPLAFVIRLQKGEQTTGLVSELYTEYIFDLRS